MAPARRFHPVHFVVAFLAIYCVVVPLSGVGYALIAGLASESRAYSNHGILVVKDGKPVGNEFVRRLVFQDDRIEVVDAEQVDCLDSSRRIFFGDLQQKRSRILFFRYKIKDDALVKRIRSSFSKSVYGGRAEVWLRAAGVPYPAWWPSSGLRSYREESFSGYQSLVVHPDTLPYCYDQDLISGW